MSHSSSSSSSQSESSESLVPLQSKWPCSDPEIVEKVGGSRYDIERELCENRATHTFVFLGKEKNPPFRPVAIKVIRVLEQYLHTPEIDGTTPWDRFCREADMWSRFGQATNVLPLYSPLNQMIDSDRDFRYLGFVMEFSPLGDLSEHIHGDLIRKLTKSQKLRFMLGIANAIQTGDNYGVTHGDIKPKNVLLFMERKTLIPKVMDFGMSASASGDTHIHGGTPEYMAPECFTTVSSGTGHITPSSDIYSLGVLFYEFITSQYYIPRANSPTEYAERWERCKERQFQAKPELDVCEKFAEGMGALLGGMLRKLEDGKRPTIKEAVDSLEAILEQVERATMLNPEADILIRRGLYRWNDTSAKSPASRSIKTL